MNHERPEPVISIGAKNMEVYIVHYEPHSKYENDQICILYITYKINTTGSRNLGLKRS